MPSLERNPCMYAAGALRGAPAATTTTMRRARSSTRAALRPAAPPPTTTTSHSFMPLTLMPPLRPGRLGAAGLSDQPPRRVSRRQAHYRYRSTGTGAPAGGRDMSEAIGQPGAAALPRPMGIGEILSTAFQLYRRHWRTLLSIAAVVVVPITLLQYLFGDLVRTQGETTRNGVVETASWSVGIAGLVAALAGILMYLVLTGAIT